MITLNKENFEAEVLKAKGVVFVKFAVKTGCKPCTDFKPRYESAEAVNKDIKFCSYERESLPKADNDYDEIEKQYEIKSFPTVLAFKDGEVIENVNRISFYSLEELQELHINIDIDRANQRKKMLQIERSLVNVEKELARRMTPPTVAPQENTIVSDDEGVIAVESEVSLVEKKEYPMAPELPEAPCDECQ